jgi:hypothetical protein
VEKHFKQIPPRSALTTKDQDEGVKLRTASHARSRRVALRHFSSPAGELSAFFPDLYKPPQWCVTAVVCTECQGRTESGGTLFPAPVISFRACTSRCRYREKYSDGIPLILAVRHSWTDGGLNGVPMTDQMIPRLCRLPTVASSSSSTCVKSDSVSSPKSGGALAYSAGVFENRTGYARAGIGPVVGRCSSTRR